MSMAAAFKEGLMLRLIWIELPSGSIWQASDSVDKEDFASPKSRDREIVTVNLLACFAHERLPRRVFSGITILLPARCLTDEEENPLPLRTIRRDTDTHVGTEGAPTHLECNRYSL
jgi:hypothetical protein